MGHHRFSRYSQKASSVENWRLNSGSRSQVLHCSHAPNYNAWGQLKSR